MLDPKLFAEFCDAYTQETNRLRMESRANIDATQAELSRIDREEEKLMDLYLKDALSIDAVKERGDKLWARKAELTDFLAGADEPPPLLPRPWPSNTGCACSTPMTPYRTIPRNGVQKRRMSSGHWSRTSL